MISPMCNCYPSHENKTKKILSFKKVTIIYQFHGEKWVEFIEKWFLKGVV